MFILHKNAIITTPKKIERAPQERLQSVGKKVYMQIVLFTQKQSSLTWAKFELIRIADNIAPNMRQVAPPAPPLPPSSS